MDLRNEILGRAAELICHDRDKTYGGAEDGLTLMWELFHLYKARCGVSYSPAHESAIFMICAKLSRIASGNYHEDNYTDICGYAALAAEIEGNRHERKA